MRAPTVRTQCRRTDQGRWGQRYVFSVAQICNLLYRRIAFCGASASANCPRTFSRPADYKSAIRQITNLRYAAALCAKHIWTTSLPALVVGASLNRRGYSCRSRLACAKNPLPRTSSYLCSGTLRFRLRI